MNIIDGNPRVFVKPDVPQAIAFLKDYAPAGPWVLTGIAEGQGAPTASFIPDQESGLGRWILQLQSEGRNVYFLAGDPKAPLTKKAVKTDMAQVRYLWADLDARRDLDWRDTGAAAAELEALYERLTGFRLPPSVIVASGGGFQAFWKLAEPFDLAGDAVKIARFEAVNKALAEALDADHCHNADRIMRLPGTVNYPNARKRGLGRVPAPATLVLFKAELVYPIEAFGTLEPTQKPAAAINGGLTSLPPWLQLKLHASPALGERSGAFFNVACALFERGLSDSQVIAVFAAAPDGVAAKFTGRGDLAAEVARCRVKWRPASLREHSTAVTPAPREPLPLMREAAKPAPFPAAALGPALAPAAEAIARAAQVPDALAGQSVLAAAALAVQGLADVETPYGACKPISLFLMTIAGSGDRKSTTDKLALRGVRAFEEAAIARYQTARKTYRRAMRDYEASLKYAAKEGSYAGPALKTGVVRAGGHTR